MSVRMSALVWKVPMSSTKKLIALRLADAADDKGENIFPSVARVAFECGVSERTIQYALRDFEKEGLLVVRGNVGGGRNRPRVYGLNTGLLATMAEPYGSGEKGATDDATEGVKGAVDDMPLEQRVQPTTQKGADDDDKGCKAFAPEPSENHQGTVQGIPPSPPPGTTNGFRKTAIPLSAFGIEPPPEPDPIRAMVDGWNALAADLGLAQVQKLTETRKAKAHARLKDCGGLDGWNAALGKVRDARWMWDGTARGGWKADFDFVVRESAFVKLMEGAYDGGGGQATGQRSGAMNTAFDRMEAENRARAEGVWP